jgi:hypothetical protein
MCESSSRKPLLPVQALDGLQQAKPQILEAVAGRVSEQLVLVTALAAVRLAKREVAPEAVLSERVLELVRDSLRALARGKWKPDTALKLKRVPGGGHGLSQ